MSIFNLLQNVTIIFIDTLCNLRGQLSYTQTLLYLSELTNQIQWDVTSKKAKSELYLEGDSNLEKNGASSQMLLRHYVRVICY